MTQSCKRPGLDIVGHLAFGFALNTQTDPKYRFIIDGVAKGNHRGNCFMQLPFLKNRVLDSILHFLSRSRRLGYLSVLQHMISTRLSMDKHAENDLYSAAADNIDAEGPDGIRLSELWSEAVFFFPAGQATPFISSLTANAYRKLSDEIRNTFMNVTEICGGPKLAGCRYLRACFDEALRMSPPVSRTPWRELAKGAESENPLVIDGHIIPPGAQIGVNIYSIHHNEDYFPEPFAFRPERWLGDKAEELQTVHQAFASFSTGARGCAGKPMAYLESSMVVAKTLWYFDFETAPGDVAGAGVPGRTDGRERQGEYQLRDVFSAAHDGPNLVFSARSEHCKDFEGKGGPTQ